MNEKWTIRFLELAEHFSKWSRDPSTQVGAIAVSQDRQILSIGWNGFPRGILDSQDRLSDRNKKYELIVHAEQNLIYNSSLNGISLAKSSLYVYGLPVCLECAKAVAQVGIKTVYSGVIDLEKCNRWKESTDKAQKIFDELDINYYHYFKKGDIWDRIY